jgi:hypothetical protein
MPALRFRRPRSLTRASAKSHREDEISSLVNLTEFESKGNPMKTKLATILAVVMFVAVGVLKESKTHATTTKDFDRTSATILPAGLPNFEHNHGRITRIYPEPTGVYFRFGGRTGQWETSMNPTNGYYFISMSHPNYRPLVDLLYLAAEHDWDLQARTQPALGTGGRADVIYLVQDFSRP